MTTTVRETRRADELKTGDWLAAEQLATAASKVLSAHSYNDGADDRVMVVYEDPDGFPATLHLTASTPIALATEADIETVRAGGDRAKFIAGLHEFASWLGANPWAPIKRDGGYLQHARLQVDLHGADMDASVAAIGRVREIADRLGVTVDESLDDRTDASVEIGSVSYSVIAWHRDGRPAESKPLVDPDASMEAHYDAEADAQAYLGKMHAKAADVRAARADAAQLGLEHSRADDPPAEADLTRKGRDLLSIAPVSPARVPLHGGNWVSKVADQAGA